MQMTFRWYGQGEILGKGEYNDLTCMISKQKF